MDDDRPTFGSLFAGIGGIDLGLERAGWECRFQVEWDPFCQRVLAKHWPDVPRYGDITAVDWSGVERVDLLAGGFPCQPVSFAGRRAIVDDDRWLWPEFERAIRALRPRLVLVENVPGLLVGGGMDAVLGGLARLGYDTEWESIPAAAVGAPHLRYRVWIVAYDDRRYRRAPGPDQAQAGAAGHPLDGGGTDAARVLPADTNGYEYEGGSPQNGWPATSYLFPYAESGTRLGRASGTNGHAPLGHQGSAPGWWRTEPDVGRVAHGVPARVDRLRSLGNAVVPQVVEMIGTQLLAALRAAA